MKKGIILVLAILLYVGWTMGYPSAAENNPGDDIGLLTQAFNATGAKALGSELVGWVKVSDNFYSLRQREETVNQIAGVFGLHPGEYDVILRSTEHYGYATMEYPLSEDVWLRIQVQTIDDETRATIEVTQSHHRDLEHRYQLINSALKQLKAPGETVKITSCLEGYVNGRLRDSEKMNLVYTAFAAVDAKFQQGADTANVTAWSGYSPLFAQSLDTGRGEVNFGVSLRVSHGTGQTLIRVATPVLPGSY